MIISEKIRPKQKKTTPNTCQNNTLNTLVGNFLDL